MLFLLALAIISLGQSFIFGNLFQFTRRKQIPVQNPIIRTFPFLIGNETQINQFDNYSNAELTTCDMNEFHFPRLCSGYDQDSPNCFCTKDYYPTTCTPQLCISNEQQYPCFCTGTHNDTSDCIRLCQEGEFPEVYSCVCPEEDDTCKAGQKFCTGGKYTQPTPSGCKPYQCDEQPHLCQCTGDESIDEVNCFCSEQNQNINLCTPRLCQSQNQGYPCLCSGNPNNDRPDCICNGLEVGNSDYYQQCQIINCRDPDVMFPGRCGCNQYNHPPGCDPTHNCHDPEQGYPCYCFDPDLNTPDCFCNGEQYHPDGCLCSNSNYDYLGCLCSSIYENENCMPICQEGHFPGYGKYFNKDNCVCDYRDQKCLDGPNTCTEDTYDPEYPQKCKIISCIDKNQNYLCICTGNEDLDTPECICKEGNNDKVDPGSCFCDPNWDNGHHPMGCLCAEEGDSYCICNDREDDISKCYTICQDSEYPREQYDNHGCLCSFENDDCMERTLQCVSGSYTRPYPQNCFPQLCENKNQYGPCICTGNINLDPKGYRDHLCNQGEFPGSDDCMCKHNDVICQTGRKICSGVSLDDPTPSGCYPILCSDKNQILPCICSGHINRDTPDCICIGQTHQETGLCQPAFCGLYAGFCICGGAGGFNPNECVCDGSIDQPDNCKSALTVVIDEGLCTGGTNIDPYPENCQLQECESSEQTAPCICNEDLDKNRPDCMCQAATRASVDQGSCICGINHHPTGCICSSSSDSGCIYSSILENNPTGCICSTTIDSNPPSCSIQDCSSSFGESVTTDSCYCTKTNYPTGCKLGLCKGIDDYPQCLCSDFLMSQKLVRLMHVRAIYSYILAYVQIHQLILQLAFVHNKMKNLQQFKDLAPVVQIIIQQAAFAHQVVIVDVFAHQYQKIMSQNNTFG
ncbi:MAG: hypothetical protein EZS28_012729 [Streblomastix strix]|uniref:EGF-like domain-containing protein n=1 Tax=Streblomastix strix TaxID=222440 RepID=A0A5J4W9Z6_9EUKA|nr:MAG: hypothetical protein EZS28_012729 [Streblomastix strix]